MRGASVTASRESFDFIMHSFMVSVNRGEPFRSSAGAMLGARYQQDADLEITFERLPTREINAGFLHQIGAKCR